jgi:hypothetical protein
MGPSDKGSQGGSPPRVSSHHGGSQRGDPSIAPSYEGSSQRGGSPSRSSQAGGDRGVSPSGRSQAGSSERGSSPARSRSGSASVGSGAPGSAPDGPQGGQKANPFSPGLGFDPARSQVGGQTSHQEHLLQISKKIDLPAEAYLLVSRKMALPVENSFPLYFACLVTCRNLASIGLLAVLASTGRARPLTWRSINFA